MQHPQPGSFLELCPQFQAFLYTVGAAAARPCKRWTVRNRRWDWRKKYATEFYLMIGQLRFVWLHFE